VVCTPDRCIGGPDEGNPCDEDSDCTNSTCETPVLTLTGIGASEAQSLRLHGTGYVKVPLDNDAYVIADHLDQWLTLQDYPKQGSGYWIASSGQWPPPYNTENGGMKIKTTVTGDGKWIVRDSWYHGWMKFYATCQELTGDFELIGGTLIVDGSQTIKTTGNLKMKDPARIKLKTGAKAMFD
jgi:hypothetical protein